MRILRNVMSPQESYFVERMVLNGKGYGIGISCRNPLHDTWDVRFNMSFKSSDLDDPKQFREVGNMNVDNEIVKAIFSNIDMQRNDEILNEDPIIL